MPNRLSQQSSPYLLQHAQNPVDWYPWGSEALERAVQEQKPIFLSIGYSACHWCHVMEHESFEDEALAQKLNESFVPVKVDREERPDLDQVYMNAVQLMTGRGGWPMSVFLTPDRQPFYGGTYWPPVGRQGMPGFGEVLDAVRDAWENRRDAAVSQAMELTKQLENVGRQPTSGTAGGLELLTHAAAKLEQVFDAQHGGFGSAPKFPHPTDLSLLLRVWERTGRKELLEMTKLSLDKMSRGGIYDHLGGGFARYSVDAKWLVPHFEKMLYDNAQLSVAYLEGFLATGRQAYAQIVRETSDYVLNYMTDDSGGFHSTEDADSEGVEGKFYVWTPDQIHGLLGAEAGERFCYVYDVTAAGNFEGQSILNLPRSVAQCAALRNWDLAALERELGESRRMLLELRDRRVRPAKDDKVLTSWNALMIDALARAAPVLAEPRYLDAAQKAARFVLSELKSADGHLLHTWRNGQAQFLGYLDDYSYLIHALQSLYEASMDPQWIEHAVRLADVLLRQFMDERDGGFFFTSSDHEPLITRNKNVHDSSVPSGNGMAATALLRLGKLCGRGDFIDAGERTLLYAQGVMEQAPTAAGQLLIAANWQFGPVRQIVFAGEASCREQITKRFFQRFRPRDVAAYTAGAALDSESCLQSLLAGKDSPQGEPTVFVCEDFECRSPLIGEIAVSEFWANNSAKGRKDS